MAGSAQITIAPAEGGDPLAKAHQDLEDGAKYTVVALAKGKGAELRVFKDGKAKRGKALIDDGTGMPGRRLAKPGDALIRLDLDHAT